MAVLGLNFVATFVATALVMGVVVLAVFTYLRRRDSESLIGDELNLDTVPIAEELAPHLREFFTGIESVNVIRGDAEVARSLIERSRLNPDYIRIGRDIESVEITVRSGEETIYEFDAFDMKAPFNRHPSIYHWLLAVDKEM